MDEENSSSDNDSVTDDDAGSGKDDGPVDSSRNTADVIIQIYGVYRNYTKDIVMT
jgi:activator of HSP90 ATPase